MSDNNKWNYKKNREFYNIETWGNGYFDIDKNGHVTVKRGKYIADKPLSIQEIVNRITQMGLRTPLVLRFTDIIKNRAQRIAESFSKAKKQLEYSGNYSLIYPVKVNQHKAVIDSIYKMKSNNYCSFGLEAGSKAELIAVLATVDNNKTPIVCNGYKDREYITIALLARKLGRNITIVIEKMIELKFLIELAQKLKVEPLIGVRCRLALVLAGKWAHSGGEKSKFGLNTTQVLELVKILQQHNMLKYLHLLHCHQGSQIANIKDIFQYINELSTMYCELYKLGAPITTIDIGGGLAVDYEGSRTRNFNSTNYNLGEYAHVIMSTIKQTAEYHLVPIPHIFSESGRAVTAHHAVFVTDIVDVENIIAEEVPEVKSNDEDLLELESILDSFDTLALHEIYSSSAIAIENIYNRFADNRLPIEKRAIAEQILSHIKQKILKKLNPTFRSHRELYDVLDEDLSKKVIANFSLFQSMPDSWAISQLFPVMPLTHLNHEPKMRAIIEDITCDSDGKIGNYIDYQGNEPSLKLPPYNHHSPYLLAVFMVGAYQEIMGNLHNLFGPVTTIDIELSNDGTFSIANIHQPFAKIDSLAHVGFNQEYLMDQLDDACKKAKLSVQEKAYVIEYFEKSLASDTYLKP